ncbi:MAG: hypothetical protein KF893_24950 [Caldilineaceae bacterium]|nr:hypothetical protein [Caldilineaceae bacterium]
MQNACENAIRHAQASQITVSGRLLADQIELCVEDNGIGFDNAEFPDFARLLAQRHFGLVSMVERAAIIGAELHIHSHGDSGTRVHLTWTDHRQNGKEYLLF